MQVRDVPVLGTSAGADAGLRLLLRTLRALAVLIIVGATAALVLDHSTGRVGHEPMLMTMVAVSLGAAVALHGLVLGRPLTRPHVGIAAVGLLLGLIAGVTGHPAAAWIFLALAAVIAVRPTGSTAQPGALPTVSSLIDGTPGDPLAPFAMTAGKSYVFSADAKAALAYRTLAGFAVVSGDPIGDRASYREVVANFVALCQARGWRILVLGASAHRLGLWHSGAVAGPRLRALPIGRDVVVDVDRFNMVGRAKRNLRQAVQRTHNAGISTEVVAEGDVDDALRAELLEVMRSSHKAVGAERGFSMMLGCALSGRYPGVWLIIARDRAGQIQGFHRYASAGNGTDLSLDLPWRRSGAPNGVDERLTVDMIEWANTHGAQRVSLAFAPFPDLFGGHRSSEVGVQALRALAHAGDRLIKLESLYRYLRKFDAMSEQRYVLFPLVDIVPTLLVLVTLEFAPRRPPADVPR
ncbi:MULTISPECIES: bifunctional lysylphosphatidylglycerol flippase/synthetase MprF [unclassified Mycolicibacterium]|uniref:bifunctional lysylphosphatidylglycerol flippase/synthetase MprF n=1 Tax=unclassified Mycolicibacterium TaxID=2636767 RepID=UPI0012DCF3E2|nr:MULTISPECIES: phosphatidylglycerol lysyltransferase domain-containing protein [unclassified Mycolicibacterium]MUL84712.1 DUF2156 domain-containing protein [Mycolicibacterium sp. CBMA 329]MUL88487.1 DUF2156 domain-containing protein [Mycolicibacterium sp. CBMA 331]MUM00174.1 DUF2156 domain-containing protein [Mycolicibacterium sp. CBMA 334]MUM27838.1 DUF2156 domain-containing protein [Mycolicibacterium sp. CBMA 295]MUM40134.1 DUF2156 domain-containing protein [Mycolicibacterium sp. CBMA 247]